MSTEPEFIFGKSAAFTAGVAGAMVSSLFGPKRPVWQVVVFILAGGVIAEYSHGLFAQALGFSEHSIAFAFWSGIFGMAFIAKVMEIVNSVSAAELAKNLVNCLKKD